MGYCPLKISKILTIVLEAVSRDVASGAYKLLDITFVLDCR